MSSLNEIIIKLEVFSQPKKTLIDEIKPNLNIPTFFLCDKKMNEKNFVKAGNSDELELASFDELNSENCEMLLDNQKVNFEKYHTFTKEGIYTIKYILKNKIKSCKKMFLHCQYIKSIDLSNFNSEDVTDMSLMFINCINLEEIKFGNFKTSKVTNMEGMFECCMALKSLDLSTFDTSNVENMNSMFAVCISLQELNVSNFNTEKVKDMNTLFGGDMTLKMLDLSSFSSANLTIMNFMFKNCFSLKEIKFSNKFQPNQIKDIYKAFLNCENLEIVNCSEDLYDVFVEKETEIYNLEKVKFVSIDGPKPELKEFKSQYHEHILKKNLIKSSIFCEGCSLNFEDEIMFSCKECNFNICENCIKMENKKGYIALKGVVHQHEMKLRSNPKEYNCKNCKEIIPANAGYYCEVCDMTYCKKCTGNFILNYISKMNF